MEFKETVSGRTQRWTSKGQCHKTEKGSSVMIEEKIRFFRQPIPDEGPAISSSEMDFKGTVSGD
jgi:hypothetical protein